MSARERLHDAAGKLGDNREADVTKVRQWTHHDQPAQPGPTTQENHMTETATAQPDAPVLPPLQAAHQNIAVFTDRVQSFLPWLGDVAANPYAGGVIEAVLTATSWGMGAEEFAAVTAVLKASPGERLDAALALAGVIGRKGPAQAPAA